MYGAILGDIIGSPYEFDKGNKSKIFPLFTKQSHFTDDTVMTIAVAEALMDIIEKDRTEDEKYVKYRVKLSMRKWGKRYPDAGYGAKFSAWLCDRSIGPYNSCGNGAAMRTSAVGWLFNDFESVLRVAKWVAEVTHNHPEGIKGAQSVAMSIFMARMGESKYEIWGYNIKRIGYDLSRTCDDIRPNYHHVETCQETVPEAITAFMEGENFIDVVRTAVSLGGDCDTIACIAGSIAEAYYTIPRFLIMRCQDSLPTDMLRVLSRFNECVGRYKNMEVI